MIIEGVDWFTLQEVEKFLSEKISNDQKLEISQGENSRILDMFDHMEYWGEIKIVVKDKKSGETLHRKTIKSTRTQSFSSDRESQYSYKLDTKIFNGWFSALQ